MVEEVVVALELVEVRVVVAPPHSEIAFVGHVFASVFPRIGVERGVADHVAHAARGGGGIRASLVVTGPVVAVAPRRVVGVDVASAYDVEFAGFEEVWCRHVDGSAIESRHGGLELGDA